MIGIEQGNEKSDAVSAGAHRGERGSRVVFGLAIFTSAFLLFQVQLILGKFLLPWFGGTSAVWTTCLLFFQVGLFAGYFYAHKISSAFPLDRQGRIHLVLLGLTSVWIAAAWYFWQSLFLPAASWKPLPGAPPIAGIVKLLLLGIGLPFLLLSSTGPLLQKWYDQLHANPGNEPPYFLYALSNAGSLLGLLSYPIVLEPTTGLRWQSQIWGIGFLFFVAACAICAIRTRKWDGLKRSSLTSESETSNESAMNSAPRWALWFTLPALASIMLLATTNLLTQDVAPIPLLWVLPLCVYLLSFILTFHRRSWYGRGIFHIAFAVTALLGLLALFRSTDMNVFKQIGIFLALLFVLCMICHGELARIKPGGRYLTAFYLTLAAGGAFGGIFVGLIAPVIFPAIWEYHLGLWAVAALLVVILWRDKQSWLHDPKPELLVPFALFTTLALVPKYLVRVGALKIPPSVALAYKIGQFAVALILVWLVLHGTPVWARNRKWRWYEISLGGSFLLLSVTLYYHLSAQPGQLVYRVRNFYGALSVRQHWDVDLIHSNFTLKHGRIIHGIQVVDNRKLTTAYYDENSGAGLALLTHPARAAGNVRVGAVGLGAGTLAAYARAGDVYRFYEINPAVIRLAQGDRGYFTFLKDAPAKIDIVPGDARLSLEAEAARGDLQKFDVLVVDAFSGDAIPMHLLTREAMQLYLSHLRGPDSVIAVHISNLAADLAPPVAKLADHYKMHAVDIRTGIGKGVILSSEWILLTRGGALDAPAIQRVGTPLRHTPIFGTGEPNMWTDDYSNIISLLNYPRPWLRWWFGKRDGQ